MSEQTAKPLFDLNLTDEQQLMRDTARRFAQTELRPASRKADEAAAAPSGIYEKTLELGFNAVQIPEALGGFGAERSPISNTLLIEDLAWGDMSLAIGALSALSFINTVLDQGTEAQQASLLARFTEDGFHPAAIALTEPGARFDPKKLKTKAAQRGDGFVLLGEKTLVPFATEAERLLVVAELEGQGPAAFALDPKQAGVSVTRESYMGLRPLSLGRVKLDNVELPLDSKLGGDKPFDLDRLLSLTRVGSAALAVGGCQAILDYTKDYCNERVAFGEPITHRQSVAFMLADMAIELDGLRLLTYRSASRAEQGLSFKREAYLAQLQAAEKGMKIATDGVQLLGGHGYIREHMVELWYRNLRAVALLDGCLAV
jgi:alkylation response protein AidB-like acyl-CoA dehydrogenase